MSMRAREVLGRYRAATSLSPADRARVLRSLQARLLAGELPEAPVAAPVPSLPKGSGVQRLVRVRWLLIATLGVLGLGAGVWLSTSDAPHRPQPSAAAAGGPGLEPPQESPAASPEPPPSAASVATPPSKAEAPPPAAHPARRKAAKLVPQPPAASPSPEEPAPALPIASEPPEAKDPQPSAVEPSRARPGALPERTRPPPARDALAEEMEVLDAAQAALRGGDARRALSLLAEHSWRFPDGHLAEAREVARILALCQAGEVARSRAQAQRFLAERPNSPFAARVSAKCP